MSAIPRSVLFVGIACVAAVAILAAIWYYPQGSNGVSVPQQNPPPNMTTVRVVDVDFIDDFYTNNSTATGYLEDTYCLNNTTYQMEQGSECQSGAITTPNCLETVGCANVMPGTEFLYNLSLFNNGSAYHTIETIGTESPFTVLSVTPSVPLKMHPGLPAVNFQIEILTPSTPGDYGLEGYVASY